MADSSGVRADVAILVSKHADRFLELSVEPDCSPEALNLCVLGLKATINQRLQKDKVFKEQWRKLTEEKQEFQVPDEEDPDSWLIAIAIRMYECVMDAAARTGLLDAKSLIETKWEG